MSGTGVAEADKFSLSIPKISGAGLALAQPKVNWTVVGVNGALGVNAITKLCACPAGMLTGVFGVPVSALVVGSVVWKRKVDGIVVNGRIVQVKASAGPASIIVAKAVAVLPISMERLSGSTAATRVKFPIVSATNVAVTEVAAATVTVQLSMPLHPPPDHPAKVAPVAADAVSVTWVPTTKLAEQVLPQLIPDGGLVTVPEPVPVSAID